MIKYAKITNKETGLCEVGLGTNAEFYKSIGMIEIDVEQSDVDTFWYLSEKCPLKTDEEKFSEAKIQKTKEVNESKEQAFKDGIIFNGVRFDCDDRAQDRTGNRLPLLNSVPVETLQWLDYDYQPHDFTPLEFQMLCSQIFERIQNIEFKTGIFIELIQQAKTQDELEKITINFEQESETTNE